MNVSVSVSVCLNAFAQFSSYEVQTSQDHQTLLGTGRGGVEDSTVSPRGQKYKVNHSKDVDSTCIRTVFKINELNLHRNVDDSSGQVVDGLTFLPFSQGVRNKGLITQKT